MIKPNLVLAALMIGGLATQGAHAHGDPVHGNSVFAQQCSVCHSALPNKNKMGPSLFGVIGRKAGSIDNFSYSDAIKNSSLKWTEDVFEAYIAAPNKLIPGVKMYYDGLADAQSREDLAAYLATLH